MNDSKIVRDLTQGSVFKLLISFSIPFIFANLLQIFYNITDMIIVGQFVGSAGLSAVSVGADLVHMQMLFCMGFSSAGQIIVSQYVGMKNTEGLRKFIGTLFSVLILMGIIMTVVGLLSKDWLLGVLNTPAEALSEARDYSTVCFFGTIFTYGYNLISAILRGMGDSRRPLLFIGVASVVNILLDLLFIAVFHMGAFGAALATIIGQAVSLVTSTTYLYRHRDSFYFDFKPKSFRIHGDSLKALFKLGIPLALQSCAVSISQLFISANVNAYGLVISAVNGVGNKISQVATVITSALSSAGSAMIGQKRCNVARLCALGFEKVKVFPSETIKKGEIGWRIVAKQCEI